MLAFNKKKGFTLVEVLVVMAIVAVLSSLAVNSYLQYRKTALIDLNTDELISQVSELKNKTIFKNEKLGKIDSIRAELSGDMVDGVDAGAEAVDLPKCYGVYFQRAGEVYSVSSFKQDFTSQKTLEIGRGWVYKGCGEFDSALVEEISLKSLVLDKQVNLVSLMDENSLPIDNLVLRFNPPNGTIETIPEIVGFVDFTLQYGTVADERFSKTARLDLTNSNFYKKREETN